MQRLFRNINRHWRTPACVALCAVLMAPAVHQFEHGLERLRLGSAIAARTQHIHADSAAVALMLEDADREGLACILCGTHLQFTPPPLSCVAYRQRPAIAVVASVAFDASAAEIDYPIRAPPALG